MKLLSSISSPSEPYLEQWARIFRFSKADPFVEAKLKEKQKVTVVDLGCGQDTQYFKYLCAVFPEYKDKIQYIGVDPLIKPKKTKQVQIIASKFEDLKLTEKADVVTMFAVLEHVDDPGKLLKHAVSLLKPDGVILATTPTPMARYPLEFFCYVLGIISKREIDEHQRYPTRASLLDLKRKLGKVSCLHEYFELGLNNFLLVRKDSQAPDLPAYSFSSDLSLAALTVRRLLS